MNARSIPTVELSGTPYEIGRQHGNLLSQQIHSQLAIYGDLFKQNCKFDWPQVLNVASDFSESIGRLAPDILEEMRGIADAVGVDLLDIVAINARSEIALGQWDDGCTSLAWRLGDSGKQIIAQNWDWRTSVGTNLALISIKQLGKPDIWMVIEPGIVGKIGFNSASVGVCLNAIRARPISTSLLPIHILLRVALECTSADSAVTTIERLGGAASSQHILIADSNGSRGLELSPRGGVYLKEDHRGIIVHTNHFLENKLVDEPPWLSGSPIRLERISALCDEIITDVGREHLTQSVTPALLRERIFLDTFNTPQAICCSPDPGQGILGSIETLFNVVMTFESGRSPRAEVTFGRSELANQTYHLPW